MTFYVSLPVWGSLMSSHSNTEILVKVNWKLLINHAYETQ